MVGNWTTFFEAQTAAFAALTGLVFVALSINLRTVLDLPGASGRAGEALIRLVMPVALGLTGLIGHQSSRVLGIEWAVIGLIGWIAVGAILVRGRQAMEHRSGREISIRVVGVQTATLLALAAGVTLMVGSDDGLYVQAGAVIACLFIGILDAWVLLVEIVR